MNKLAAALAVLATTLSAGAEEARRPSIGVGIGVVPIEVAGARPTVEIYLPITAGPRFRIEPSLGVFTNDQREGGVDSSNVTVGFGAFFVTSVAASTDVYAGGRLKLNFVTVDTATTNDSENDFAIAAAVGAEHYIAQHFSLGAEGQFGKYQNGKLSGAVALNDHGFFTTGLAFVRFYFR